jgi:hypothetical protein
MMMKQVRKLINNRRIRRRFYEDRVYVIYKRDRKF